MRVLLLGLGSLSLVNCSIECSWMASLTPTVIVMRGLVFNPLFCMLWISGSYLVCVLCFGLFRESVMAVSEIDELHYVVCGR